MTTSSALRLSGVRVWVEDGTVLLDDVSFSALVGEHWAVLGPNGAGKTTLLSLLGAWRHPSAGSVDVLGERLGRTDMRALRERIGWVGSTAAPPPPRLAVRTVTLTGATGTIQPLPGAYGPGHQDRAALLLRAMGCERLAARRVGTLSDGERRRVLIARALMPAPALLLLDEPAAGLDLPAREAMTEALARLAADHPDLTTVTVTHHVEELPATTTHALLLRDGRVTAKGPVDDVLSDQPLSTCFGLPLSVRRHAGRWSAFVQRPQTLPIP